MDNISSYLILGLLALVSTFLYGRKLLLSRIVPTAVVIGIIMLVFGRTFPSVQENVLAAWKELSGILINIVFATLLIGKPILSPKKIWKFAGPQVVFGQTLAWGQYVIGALLTLLVLIPLFDMNPLAGALIEISFEGGHGTAAGLQNLFTQLNFSEGVDIALGLATVGLVVGIASGLLLNFIYNRRKVKNTSSTFSSQKSIDKEAAKFIRETHNNYFSRHVIVRTIVQILLIGLAIAFGLFLKELLILLESYFIGSGGIQFFSYIPLFPLAMIGGALLQLSLKALGMQQLVHPKTMNFVSDFALELLIIAAVSTISLVAISNNLGPFILLALAGIVWNISAFLVLAPRLMGRKMWFRRGIGDYGQSMGMTATGLLLMHAADPHNRSHAVERFGYKQLLFEPIVGGGLFTASSMIIIYDFGLVSLLLISVVVLVVWLIVGYYAFARHTK